MGDSIRNSDMTESKPVLSEMRGSRMKETKSLMTENAPIPWDVENLKKSENVKVSSSIEFYKK